MRRSAAADGDAPRENEPVDALGDERLSNGPGPLDDTEDAVGKSRRSPDLPDLLTDERNPRARFQDDCIPGHQGHGDLGHGDSEGVIPGGDDPDDTPGLVPDRALLPDEPPEGHRDGMLLQDLSGIVGEVPVAVENGHELGKQRLGAWFARLTADDSRDLVDLIVDDAVRTPYNLPPRPEAHIHPLPGTFARRRDDPTSLLRRRCFYFAQPLPGGRARREDTSPRGESALLDLQRRSRIHGQPSSVRESY